MGYDGKQRCHRNEVCGTYDEWIASNGSAATARKVAQRSNINLLCFINLRPRSSRSGIRIEPTDAFNEMSAAGLVSARDLLIAQLAQQAREGVNSG
jgi:hypothetical protein